MPLRVFFLVSKLFAPQESIAISECDNLCRGNAAADHISVKLRGLFLSDFSSGDLGEYLQTSSLFYPTCTH